ncbi:hypothetical protein, partial [Klebsiella pneumoniae]|uniref:hypothetical protein n=1 Tax=Klebsiella pneumoniae TaxID=573 RepID=UPI001CC1F663
AAGGPNAAATGEKWRTAAEMQHSSGEFYHKAAKAHARKKESEGNSWHQAGQASYNAAQKLVKALEVEAAGGPN